MMLIGEVARRVGLRPSTLRYYERIGLLPRADRRSGRRQYGEDVLIRLTVIRFACDLGFTLTEIRALFDGKPYSVRPRELAKAKVVELDGVIARAERMKSLLKVALRCNCVTPQECAKLLEKSKQTKAQYRKTPKRRNKLQFPFRPGRAHK